MTEDFKVSFKANFYWIYLVGFFLIILQLINIIPPWFTPTDWGKTILFRIILSVLIFILLTQILFKKINVFSIKNKLKTVRLPLLILASLFSIYLLATIFSLDPHFSLWGDPDRNGGFVNFAFYIAFSILLFLIVKEKDWKKIIDFSIIIGIIVCAVAIIQQFGLFNFYFISFSFRPVSTMGNTILLSLYLLLLTFPTLSFAIKEINKYKKIFYFFAFVLFLLINVFLTETRGTIAGLGVGFLWFVFGYQELNKKIRIKAFIIFCLILSIMFASKVYLDSHLDTYKKIPPIISDTIDRTLSIFEGSKIMPSRISAWKVSLEALKERPILGYGPENFMIAFDKYYDPTLPLIGPDERGKTEAEWWNRAHNVLFDISLTTGIPSLIIYISLFIVLIYELQKSKKTNSKNSLKSHALQATFIGYFISLLFCFDSASTYLTFFLLIGYSLHLISSNKNQTDENKPSFSKFGNVINKLYPYRIATITPLLIILFIFIYAYNIKPLTLNSEINVAGIYSDKKLCTDAIDIINKIYPQIKGDIIDNYLSRKSIVVLYGCIRNSQNINLTFVNQAIKVIKETTNYHPAYLQNWLLLGEFDTLLINEKNKLTNFTFTPSDEMNALKNEVNYYFQEANKLSPKRQLVLLDWARAEIMTDEYREAEKKAAECINLNQNYHPCIWQMALIKRYSNDLKGFNYYYDLAKKQGYFVESEKSLKQLIDVFIKNGDYASMVVPYQRLIEVTTDNQQKAQLHASLAAAYVELKQFSDAKKEAQKIFELIPYFPLNIQAQARAEAEAFINGLGK